MCNYVRRGSGEPLVLIHGLGSQWQMWSPVLDIVAAERDVVALDLPGFGESAPLDVAPTVAALADSVSALIDALGLHRPHVAGNSLGGAIALELARTGRARSATSLSPVGFARGRERTFARTSLSASRATARLLDPAVDVVMRTRLGRTLTLIQFFGKPWRLAPQEAVRATRGLAHCPGFAATLPEVERFAWEHGDLDVPVTIAWGMRDRLLIPRQGRRAEEIMRRARHVRLAGCGHVPTWDEPHQVAGVLLAGSRDRLADNEG